MKIVVTFFLAMGSAMAFVLPSAPAAAGTPSVLRKRVVTAGLFDIFGGEEAQRRKEEDFEKQQAILRNRQDPNKQKKYFNEVEERRRKAADAVSQKFNLSKGGKQDPAIKWMELRKKGVIGEREKYEGQDSNRGIVIPQVPFGIAKYDEGERFDLRLPYVDDGYVDESASFGNTFKRLFGFGKPAKPTTLPNDGKLEGYTGPNKKGPQKNK